MSGIMRGSRNTKAMSISVFCIMEFYFSHIKSYISHMAPDVFPFSHATDARIKQNTRALVILSWQLCNGKLLKKIKKIKKHCIHPGKSPLINISLSVIKKSNKVDSGFSNSILKYICTFCQIFRGPTYLH